VDNPDDLEITLRKVADALEEAGVRFHLTGGLASSLYGEPRFTQDVDVVIEPCSDSPVSHRLIAALSRRFLLSDEAAREALRTRQMFRAIDSETLIKVDLYTAVCIPGELSRSVRHPISPNLDMPVVSREDAILSKLLWIRRGSEKSRHDVIGMLLNPAPFDHGYLNSAARALGVGELLDDLRGEANRSR